MKTIRLFNIALTILFILSTSVAGNGVWSKWSDYSTCSVTCGGGVQTKSRMCSNRAPNENGHNCSGNNVDERICNTQNCSNPFTKHYMEKETAYLKCSVEFKEIMEIATIKYEKGTCSHNDLHGIGNICNGMTECTFNVSNSNVGSSCGANGTASLAVMYNCIRNGGWSDWKNTTTSCPVNCDGAFQNVTRSCTKPTPNELGAWCSGTSFDEQICNDNSCPFIGSVCRDTKTVWTCPDGYIQMKRADWIASNTCGVPGITSKFDVLREMRQHCNERKSCTFTANDNTFNVSCKELHKTCSQLEYEYICTKAKLNTWTEWSICSKSCGSGEQVRTRNCLNQFNTTDGYLIDCKGSSEETRMCNSIQCPYCDENIFPHQIPSNFKLKRDVSSNSGKTDIYKIGCCGTVNAFQFIPINTGDVKFIVWRRVRGNTYKAIKKNTISVTAQNIGKFVQHNLTKYERIAVVHDDIVGWYDGGNNIIGYYDCSPDNETCMAFSLMKTVNDGDEIDTDGLPSISEKIFAWNFSTTENMAVELSFADDSIEIPDNSAVDTYVTNIRIKDPDQGDFIENIKLDYDNQYFYFDTKLRNIYVKEVLPHTVGQKSYSHNITLTVQDSCYNSITTNVTILIYNVPPVISGLQNTLEIDHATAESNPYLAKFQVKDPSGDNISCMINETNVPTELFYLQLDDKDAYLRLMNNVSIQSNTSSEFILIIICGDGTENTEFELKLKFRPKNEGTSTIPSNEPSAMPIIIGVCVFMLCLIILVILACFCKRRRKLVVNETSEDKLKYATCSVGADVIENQYNDMGQTVDQHKTNDYVEMSGKPPEKEKAFHLGTSEVGAYTEAWR
ncbi:uncharacterized protein LOC127732114 isoform X8 [Mytilus californianus]|uniref:uncharacterized protein LOC127732114 isoform X8 n=1 Tax=Mytilus californianus TaxID=6549 RepID=UPI002247A4C5|nr:uncharacterized protein LOC127732114 isoform X8 [Mytilus californianus]